MALGIEKVIIGVISLIVGLVLLPVMAGFVTVVSNNSSLQAISGTTTILPLILYGFCFGLVGIGVGMIYMGYKGF